MLAVLTVQNDLDDTLANLAGDGELSLREAVELANNPGLVIDGFVSNDVDDTIQFDGSLSNSTITLTEGQLDLEQTLTINGANANPLTISGNNASRIFGAFNAGSSTFTINDLTLTSGNNLGDFGGAIDIFTAGELNLNRVIISNSVAGIGNAVSVGFANLNITDSAIVNNVNASGIGTIMIQDGTAAITSTTISGNNSALAMVGAIAGGASAMVTLTNVTVADNTGNGVAVQASPSRTSTVNYQNSIFANNTGNNFILLGLGGTETVTSLGNNILDDASDPSPHGSDLQNTDPLLLPLVADMGTFVHPLRYDSPAIDAAATPPAPLTDQRGVARSDGDLDSTVAADIGAYEFEVIFSLTVQNTLDDTLANLAGDGELSLREAVELANNPGLIIDGFASPSDPIDIINFDPALANSTITLTAGNLQLDESATIQSLGADLLAIDGNGGSIFDMDGANAAKTFTVNDLTLTGAVNTVNLSGSGDDTLYVNRVVARDNADPNGSGSVMVASFADIFVTDSALVNNAHNGHAFDVSQGSASFTNVTFSGNAGNAISTFSGTGTQSISLLNVTIADNGGAGVAVRNNANAGAMLTIEYMNSIFADNTSGNFEVGTFAGTLNVTSLGNNILDDMSGDLLNGTDQLNTDPLLLPLVEDSGTFVRPLRFDSPAIDAASGAPALDQRGVARADGDFDTVVAADIGAYEYVPPVLTGDVIIDLTDLGFEDGMDDTVTLRRVNPGTAMIEVYVNGNLYTTLDEALVTSLTINGSSDNDTLLIEETAEGLPQLPNAVPSGNDNPLLTGAPAFEFNGGDGSDLLTYTFIAGGFDFNTIYAARDGAGSGNDEGELFFSDTGGATNSHHIYFTGLEPISTTGPVGGTLTVRGDNAANSIIVDRADLVGPGGGAATDTRVFISNAELFDFAANTYTGLVLEGLGGDDTIEVRGFADGETDLAQLTLDGHTADAVILAVNPDDDAVDTLLLRTNELPGALGTGITTDMFGRGGNDILEVGNTTNGLGQIFGTVNAQGNDNDTTTTNYSITAKTNTPSDTLEDGDLLTILDDANTAASTYTLTGTTIDRTGAAQITYGTIERLTINTSDTASSDIDITNTATNVVTTINAGDVADDIDITFAISGSVLVVNAGGGADTIDQADDDSATLTYLRGDAGNDTITIVDTGSGALHGLDIDGGADDDSITINQFGGFALNISGDAGADVINLEDLNQNAAADLYGGTGNDTFNIGNAVNGLDDVDGEVCIFGEGHDTAPTTPFAVTAKGANTGITLQDGDLVNLLDDAETSASTYTISDTQVQASNQLNPILFATIERLVLNTSDTAASDINVTNTPSMASTTINAGAMADDIDVTTTGASSVLTVNAAAGDDSIDVAGTGLGTIVQLRGDAGADSITLSGNGDFYGADVEGGSENDTITVTSLNATLFAARMNANGGTGDDLFNFEASDANTFADLFGDAGNDTFNIGNTTSGIDDVDGQVCVFGEANAAMPDTTFTISAKGGDASIALANGDELNILDAASTTSSTYTISDTTISRTGAGSITYTTIETLNINTSSTAASDINVSDTADGVATTITAGAAADDVSITTTGDGSVLTINAGAGADTVGVATTGAGSLTFLNGEDDADSITVTNTGTGATGLQISGGASADTITVNNFAGERLSIDGDGDTDSITLEGIAATGFADLFGSGGSDTFNIGDTTNGLDDVLGEVCIFGEGHGAGSTNYSISAKGSSVSFSLTDGDLLNILDDASTNSSTYTITDSTIDRTGVPTIIYDTIERLTVNTSDTASSDINVTTTGGAVVTTINAGDAADDIDITTTNVVGSVLIVNAGGGADTIDVADNGNLSLTYLNGEAGADSITVADTGSGLFNALQITGGTEDDSITIQQFDGARLNIDGDAGADVINLEDISSSGNADLFGSEGNDTFNIGDTTNGLDDIDGNVCVFGEDHDATPTTNYTVSAKANSVSLTPEDGDELNILDADETEVVGTATYTVTDSTVDRDTGVPAIMYDSIERLNINTSADASDINVTTTAGPLVVTTINAGDMADAIDITTTGDMSVVIVNAGDGPDTITVASTGADSITYLNGQGGNDTITVMDSGAGSAIAVDGGTGMDVIDGMFFDGSSFAIVGSDDADTFNIDSVAAGSTVVYDGAGGNDTFTVGTVADGLNNILGTVCIIGNSNDLLPASDYTVTAKGVAGGLTGLPDGDLLIILDDANTAASTYTITGTTIQRTGTGVIEYNTVERVEINTSDTAASNIDVTSTAGPSVVTTINAGDVADDIDVTTTADSSVLIINAGGGADTVDVANTGDMSVLYVRGDAGADSITLVDTGTGTGSAAELEGGTENDVITINNFDGVRLRVDGDDDDDSITLEGLIATGFADLFGGAGNDTFNIGDTTNGLDDILGEVCVFGETNDADFTDYSINAKGGGVTFPMTDGDLLNILDDASTNSSTYTITDSTIDRTGVPTIMYDTIERLTVNTSDTTSSDINVTTTDSGVVTTINAGGAADDIDITTTGGSSVLIVNAGGGADTIDVADNDNLSLTYLNGEAGADSITVADTGTGLFNALQITGGTEDDTITILQFDGRRLNIDGDAGADVINLEDIINSGVADLFGSEGNDTFNIGDTTNGIDDIDGEVCVFGEDHDATPDSTYTVTAKMTDVMGTYSNGDVLNILDAASAGANTYTITDTTIDRTGTGTIMYETIETLNINTSATMASDIDVTDTADNVVTTINAGAAADDIDITLTGTASVLTVNAAAGDDSIDVATTGPNSLTFLRGDAGADSITINDAGAGSGMDIDGGTENDIVTVNDFNGLVLNIDGDAGDDSVRINALDAVSLADLFGDTGNDAFTIGSAASGLDNVDGQICVFGEDNEATPTIDVTLKGVTNSLPAGDRLTLEDSAGTGGTYDLSATTFTRTGSGSVTYATTETVILNLSSTGPNTVNVASTASSVSTFINGSGVAMDTVNVATTGTMSSVVISTIGGSDSITVSDTGAGSFLQVNAGLGNDTINLTSTGNSSYTELNGGAGNDTLNLLALGGSPVTSLGADSHLCVNGDANDDTITMTFLSNQRINSTATVMLNGGTGSDDIVVDSSADTLPRTTEMQLETTDGTDLQLRDFGGTGGMIEIDDNEEYRFNGGPGGGDLIRILGTPGNDTITVGDVGSGAQFDISGYNCVHLVGYDGNDILSLQDSTDPTIGSLIDGNGGDDTIRGGAGPDVMYGGAGIDMMFGNDGNDYFFPDNDADGTETIANGDVTNGGNGFDSVAGCGTLDQLISIERYVDCGQQKDVITWLSGQVVASGNAIFAEANALPCTVAANTRMPSPGPTPAPALLMPALPPASVMSGEKVSVDVWVENATDNVVITAQLEDASFARSGPPALVQVEGNKVTVTTSSGFEGTVMVKVTATDGGQTATSMLEVDVTSPPAHTVVVVHSVPDPGSGSGGGTPSPALPLDVNLDGKIDVVDALAVINMLLTQGSQPAAAPPVDAEGEPGMHYDVDNNGQVDVVDALLIINYLLSENSSGSSAAKSVPAAAPVPVEDTSTDSADAVFAEMGEGEPSSLDYAELSFAMSIDDYDPTDINGKKKK